MESYDYVIVGGGTAGCVLANRLTASGRYTVLVLEAGGEPRSPWINMPAGFSKLLVNPTYNWRFQTEPEANTLGRTIAVPRGKGLGGSTLINGMIYVRGQASDFDAWGKTGAQGWGWEQVEPYFRKLEDCALAVTPVRERYAITEAFVAAAHNWGLPANADYNGGDQTGAGYYEATQRHGRRASAYSAYLKPVRHRKTLTVRSHAQVEHLVLDGSRCTGVRYRIKGGVQEVRGQRSVILCAGTIQSPQILEISGIGCPEVLQPLGIAVQHSLAGVGENYIDHYCTRMNWRVQGVPTLNEMTRDARLVTALLRYVFRGTGYLTLGTGLAYGFVKTRPDLPAPDVQYFFMHASYANAAERILDKQPGMTLGVSQLRPESAGSIHVRSRNVADAPTIRPNFLAEPVDQESLVAGMKIGREIMATEPMCGHVVAEMEPGDSVQSDAQWLHFARENGQTIYHPIGTCRLGEDAGAVVDSRLRVHGLTGLRVVDASVIPAMVSGNIQATVMMLAEKAAEMVLQDAASENTGPNPPPQSVRRAWPNP